MSQSKRDATASTTASVISTASRAGCGALLRESVASSERRFQAAMASLGDSRVGPSEEQLSHQINLRNCPHRRQRIAVPLRTPLRLRKTGMALAHRSTVPALEGWGCRSCAAHSALFAAIYEIAHGIKSRLHFETEIGLRLRNAINEGGQPIFQSVEASGYIDRDGRNVFRCWNRIAQVAARRRPRSVDRSPDKRHWRNYRASRLGGLLRLSSAFSTGRHQPTVSLQIRRGSRSGGARRGHTRSLGSAIGLPRASSLISHDSATSSKVASASADVHTKFGEAFTTRKL